MKYQVEDTIHHFHFWGGAKDTIEELTADEMDSLDKNGVRFVVLGNRERLDPALNETIDACMDRTKDNERLTLIIFLSYSGKWDILQAAKKLILEVASTPDACDKINNLSISDFDNYLVTAGVPDPDLIVRTGGDLRISNFLLWQAAYSELYFTDTLWPDMNAEEIDKAIDEFYSRKRRFGGLNKNTEKKD